MFVSFVLVLNEIEEQVGRTLQSIIDQTENDWEVILVINKMVEEKRDFDIARNHFWNIDRVKIIVNSSVQGEAVCWNSAIDLADGKYVKFINNGDILKPNFIESLKKELTKYEDKDFDLIEYDLQLYGYVSELLETFLDKDKIYDLNENYLPFAHIGPALINKLFRTNLLKEFGFKFKRFVRFDMLFVYKVLGQTKLYIYLNTKEPLEEFLIEKVQYSVFDLVNQWIHILNYYRRIGKYKKLKDYLNYAYYKTLIHNWLRNVLQYDNKLLIKKAVNFATRKFEDKREDFIKNNEVFNKTRDKQFVDVIINYSNFIKDILKYAK